MPLIEEYAPVHEWFLSERGITAQTLAAFDIRVRGDGAVIFPYPYGVKARKGIPNGEREFSSPPGVSLGLFWTGEASDHKVAFICEGETDTMRLWQELEGDFDIFGLSGVEAWQDEYKDELSYYDAVYVILDNDEDYNVAHRSDACWRKIRLSLGSKVKRITLPSDVKDICEFFNRYTLDTLRTLVEQQMKARPSRYKALDLTIEPKPYDWLVDDLLCKGDTVLMVGEPGVGKSWLSMSLSAAIAEGNSSWLGKPLHATAGSRVLYVDEENPEDLVYNRLRLLGLNRGARNIRYLHRQGIRLDKHPDVLLDEALMWEPSLIVLDSLTRLHTQDENNAGMVAGLFNDGINPLARDTGATVMVLHHVNKSESSSSFARSRGSGDITASIDTGLDIRKIRPGGHINIVHFKSRRRMAGDVISAHIANVDDGVSIEVVAPEEAPF